MGDTEKEVEKYEDKEEYAYLKNGFSSECFRIEVRKLPKFFGNIKTQILKTSLKYKSYF